MKSGFGPIPDFAALNPGYELSQVLAQEFERVLPGELRARLVVAAALIAMKAVLRFRKNEDLAILPALLLDRLHVAHRNGRILFAEMQERGYLRLFIGKTRDNLAKKYLPRFGFLPPLDWGTLYCTLALFAQGRKGRL